MYDSSTGAAVTSAAPISSMARMTAHGKVSSIPNSRPILLGMFHSRARGEATRFAGTRFDPMQQFAPMQRSYEAWTSRHLGRPMEMLWFGTAGYPVLMFPTSMGRFYQYEDQHTVDQLAAKVDAGQMQLVCVDSVDAESWYNDAAPPAARGERQAQYDAYLRDELAPYVQARAGRPDLGVFGCSFGGYHASNFAARHPEIVTKAVCFSGIYDIHRFLHGYWDDTDYYQCPTAYIPNMDGALTDKLRHIDWVIAT